MTSAAAVRSTRTKCHLGAATLSLQQGCDCFGEIRCPDAMLADYRGRPFWIANAICVHEEDTGILPEHVNYRFSDQPHVRRDRRLIVSAMCTHTFTVHTALSPTLKSAL